MKRIIVALLTVCCLMTVFAGSASAASISTDLSYTYDNNKNAITAPLSHSLSSEITEASLGVDGPLDIADIAVFNDTLYILSKGDGAIYLADLDGGVKGVLARELGLASPESFFISDTGEIYIADTENKRILKLSADGGLLREITAPPKEETNSTVDFYPVKIVVDKGERLYIIVRNETNGIYQLDILGNFLGFYGSVPVVPDFVELFWRSVSTKEQLSQMLLFVPTEYSSMDIDQSGFIYTTVATNTDSEMRSFIEGGGSDTTLAPIRRLNPKNIDVLLRTGSMPPAGDLISNVDWRTDSGNASRFIDIAVRENGTYAALDSTRNRVFTYDKTGKLLYVFGNENDTKEGLLEPTALCWWGESIAVADRQNRSVKVYAPTEYATLIDKAVDAETRGDYDASYNAWQEILTLHSGNTLAAIGMGKYYLRQGDCREAMKWFKKVDSKNDYSTALKQYRKEVGYKLTGIAISAVAVLSVGGFFLSGYLKKRNRDKKRREPHPVSAGIKYGFYIMRHPFDGFWDMRFEGRGNVVSASLILAATVFLNLVGCFAKGYLVAGNHGNNFNLLIEGVLSILLPVMLFAAANWSVTSLMNGSGNFKHIYMYTCYALTPLLIGMPLTILLSNIISLDEMVLYTILNILFYVWVGFLIFAGTLTVHQYSAGGTLAAILLIIVAMAIIIFIVLLCTTVVQQITDFVRLLLEEIRLRS